MSPTDEDDKVNWLKHQNQALQSTVSALNYELLNYTNDDKVNQLKQELEETKAKMLVVENENEALKVQHASSCLDYAEWKQWSTTDVYMFMLSVEDGILFGYNNELKMKLFEGQYKGTDLCLLTMNDIKDLGVTVFEHRKILKTVLDKMTQNELNVHEDAAPMHTNFQPGDEGKVDVELQGAIEDSMKEAQLLPQEQPGAGVRKKRKRKTTASPRGLKTRGK
eukprot:115844_1